MIPSIQELLTAQTADEVFAAFVQALVNLGIPANLWRSGGVASTILRVVAITYAGFSSLIVAALAAQFLPYATGQWLSLLAYYVYGVTRIPATYASTPCTLTNTGGGIYTYAAGQFTVKDSTTGVTFTNQAGFTLLAAGASPTSIAVTFVATLLGSAGNSDPGNIDTLVTSALGVSVTNPGPAIGIDAQSDPDLRTTCLNALAARSVRGPRGSYAYAIKIATNPVTGAPVLINRLQVLAPGATYVNGVAPTPPTPGAPGTVTIYAASPSGVPSSSDLAGAGASIDLNARPPNVTVNLIAATGVPYTRSLTVWAQGAAGVSSAALQTAAASAVATFFSTYPIGGLATDNPTTPQGLFGAGITAAIGASNPAIFFVEDSLNRGNAPPDLALADGEVAVDNITIAVRLTPATSS